MSVLELLLRSSVAVAAPSQQHYNLALKWSSHRRALLKVLTAALRGRTRRAAPRGGTRAAAAAQH